MKTGKPFLNMDERNKQIAYKVMAVMYLLTIVALQGVVLYRQFILKQSIQEFEDVAVIMTINSLFLICALLYFGAIPVRRLRIKWILLGYGLIIVFGTVFTYVKYNIVQAYPLTPAQMFDKLIIIFTISGLVVLFFVLFSFLGQRKIEKELE